MIGEYIGNVAFLDFGRNPQRTPEKSGGLFLGGLARALSEVSKCSPVERTPTVFQ